jgi:glycosyltransferase involved in cell wall biosynthesis
MHTNTLAVPLAPAATRTTTPADGLSICIPVYNEEGAITETLTRCLAIGAALKGVGVNRLEVIAVDDGSKDRSAEIIESHPVVRLIRHDGNKGYGRP